MSFSNSCMQDHFVSNRSCVLVLNFFEIQIPAIKKKSSQQAYLTFFLATDLCISIYTKIENKFLRSCFAQRKYVDLRSNHTALAESTYHLNFWMVCPSPSAACFEEHWVSWLEIWDLAGSCYPHKPVQRTQHCSEAKCCLRRMMADGTNLLKSLI